MDYKFIDDLLPTAEVPNEGIHSRVLQKDEHVNITSVWVFGRAGTLDALSSHAGCHLHPEGRG